MVKMDTGVTVATLVVEPINQTDIPVLDGIRGFLALWVLLGHSLYLCGGYIPVVSAPGVAVYTFMVMSGFLMAYHFRHRESREPWSSSTTWLRFYTRRFFRISPLYYLVLLVAFLFHQQYMTAYYDLRVRFAPPFEPFHPHQLIPNFDLTSLLWHASFLFGLSPAQVDNNVLPDWSIGLEMQFYFVFPFLMLCLRQFGVLWFAALALVVAFAAQPLRHLFPQPSFLPLVLTTFVVGILISEAWMEQKTALASGVLALFLSSLLQPFMFQAIVLAIAILIFLPRLQPGLKLSVVRDLSGILLGGRLGRFLGDRSYSIYLIHMLLLVPFVSILARYSWYLTLRPLERFSIVAPLTIIACYVLSSLTLWIIENPGIALGRRLLRRQSPLGSTSTR